jgi:sec-independent protein translocase protein TatB
VFGIGGSEIIVILVLALIFLGPDKLPDAAKQISKGIRDLKRHGRVLQRTIEDDEHIGGAIRDLKSALNSSGEELLAPSKKPPLKRRKKKRALVLDAAGNPVVTGAATAALATAGEPTIMPPEASTLGTSNGASGTSNDTTQTVPAAAAVAAAEAAVVETSTLAAARPAITLPPTAGERDPEDKSPAAVDADDAAELAAMIRPAAGTVHRATGTDAAAAAAKPVPEPEHS